MSTYVATYVASLNFRNICCNIYYYCFQTFKNIFFVNICCNIPYVVTYVVVLKFSQRVNNICCNHFLLTTYVVTYVAMIFTSATYVATYVAYDLHFSNICCFLLSFNLSTYVVTYVTYNLRLLQHMLQICSNMLLSCNMNYVLLGSTTYVVKQVVLQHALQHMLFNTFFCNIRCKKIF